MKPKDFVNSFKKDAKSSEKKTGIPAISILAQAAVESAWGSVAPGFMFFGVKDTDGINGNEQLLTTTEYSRRSDLKFPVIISVKPVLRKGEKWFKYSVKDYFRKYKNAEESFTHHCNFLLSNPRYKKALSVKADPYKFVEELAAAGYATDPNYAQTLKAVMKMIEPLM